MKTRKKIIQLKKIDNKHTNIVATMVGFGDGVEWERAYQFFVKGNTWTHEQLLAANK